MSKTKQEFNWDGTVTIYRGGSILEKKELKTLNNKEISMNKTKLNPIAATILVILTYLAFVVGVVELILTVNMISIMVGLTFLLGIGSYYAGLLVHNIQNAYWK